MASSRGTFASWLGDQVTRPDTDPIGWLARQWKALEGPDRPKVSSPTGISRHLKTLRDDTEWQGFLGQAINEATDAYRAQVQAQSLADHQQAGDRMVPLSEVSAVSRLQQEADARTKAMDAPGEVMELRTDDLAGQLMAPVPPTSSEQGWALPGGVSAADATYLAGQLDQIQSQLGIVMQMLAVSNPLAAQLLLDHVGAEDASAAEGPGAGQLTDAQQVAASIAQANGWVPADQPPTPSAAPAGGFEAWWGVAEPEPGAGSPPQSHG